jgi:hypothetical protein
MGFLRQAAVDMEQQHTTKTRQTEIQRLKALFWTDFQTESK